MFTRLQFSSSFDQIQLTRKNFRVVAVITQKSKAAVCIFQRKILLTVVQNCHDSIRVEVLSQ